VADQIKPESLSNYTFVSETRTKHLKMEQEPASGSFRLTFSVVRAKINLEQFG